MADNKETSQTGAADGTSISLSFRIGGKQDVRFYVDNGAGGVPANYELSYETHAGSGNFMTSYNVAGSTAFAHEVSGNGDQAQVTLTNTSGATADHRLRVVYE